MKDFTELALPAPLPERIRALAYTTPTPIQVQAIPHALSGQDIIATAETGSGKTAAFGIPMIAYLLEVAEARALVLVPTRELAAQVTEALEKLGGNLPQIKVAMLIGGVPVKPQLRALAQNPRIIVATPGRLLDHMQHRAISLQKSHYVVLDEADRMLDMGFMPQISRIMAAVPPQRQTLLFSATMPAPILKLCQRFLFEPVRVTVGQVAKPVSRIHQEVLHTTQPKKSDSLIDELNARKGSVLVFARTKSRTDRVAKLLHRLGHNVTRIHGDRSQQQRNEAIEGFRVGRYRIMVATDIAARGIDIPHIAHVINYDLPQCPEDYIHRIGRTARAGAEGNSLSLLTPEDKGQWHEISRLIERN